MPVGPVGARRRPPRVSPRIQALTGQNSVTDLSLRVRTFADRAENFAAREASRSKSGVI